MSEQIITNSNRTGFKIFLKRHVTDLGVFSEVDKKLYPKMIDELVNTNSEPEMLKIFNNFSNT